MVADPITEALLIRIGEKLRRARRNRNEKIMAVGKTLRISHSVISQIENGKYRGLSVDLLSRMTSYYGMNIEELISQNEQVQDSAQMSAIIASVLSENKLLREKIAVMDTGKMPLPGDIQQQSKD